MSKIYSIGDEEELVADMPNIINERIKAELEEIKAEMEDKLEPFILGERNLKKDALQILDNHIKELNND